jgi:two-component system OmpR family response regulator/two-component system response regulator RstA
MPSVLVVEDEPRLAEMVVRYLSNHGFDAHAEGRGADAVAWLQEHHADAVLLDLGLPDLDGLDVCRRIRPSFEGSILILTARGDALDEVVGLDAGADDYIAKPVRPEALVARLRAHLRRAQRLSTRGTGPLTLGTLSIDASARRVELDGDELSLSTAEFDLLWFLAQRAGEVVDRQSLYRELLGRDYDGIDRTIDLRVSKLRKRLGDDAHQPQRLKSIRGAGYLLVPTP